MKALEADIHNPPFIHEYTLSPPLRGYHNWTAKFPMPGTEVFMKVYPFSHPFPHFAQPCSSGLCIAHSLIARSRSVLCSLFRLYSRSYYSCEKAAGVNLESSLRGKGSAKNGRGHHSLRAPFSRSLSTQVTGVGTCV